MTGGASDPDPLPRGKVRWSRFFATGLALGMSPADVKACSLWEFMAAVNGVAASRESEAETQAPSAEEYWKELENG